MSSAEGGVADRGWRLWAKAVATLLLTALAGVIGFLLLPGQPPTTSLAQPTIVIGASQRGVTAVVSMRATGYSTAPGGGDQFELSLQVLSRITKPLTFEIRLNNLRALRLTRGVTPIAPAGVRAPAAAKHRQNDYLASLTFQPASTGAIGQQTPAPTPLPQSVEVTTLRPVVAAPAGPDLQITFPLIENELVTPAPSAFSADLLPVGEFLSNVPMYHPVLEPGASEFDAGHANLADYQTLAGDPPTLEPGEVWSWNGVGAVTLLAQNVIMADRAQQGLFWAGIALGVGAASAIALLVECTSVFLILDARRQRKSDVAKTDLDAKTASSETGPGGLPADPPGSPA